MAGEDAGIFLLWKEAEHLCAACLAPDVVSYSCITAVRHGSDRLLCSSCTSAALHIALAPSALHIAFLARRTALDICCSPRHDVHPSSLTLCLASLSLGAGGSVSVDNSKNRKLYGSEVTSEAILGGTVLPPPELEGLYMKLNTMVEVRNQPLCIVGPWLCLGRRYEGRAPLFTIQPDGIKLSSGVEARGSLSY